MYVNNKNLCTYCFEELPDNTASCKFCGNNSDSQQPPTYNLPAGTILLGKFIIGKLLGKGGFGITYLAYDLRRECKVAIKEYMPDTLSYRTPGNTLVSTYLGEKEESFKLGSEKFYDEAKTISKFNGHPNVINVYEFFYENNTAYFVMEYINGVDLKKYLLQKGGIISEEECISLLNPIMDALIVVHSVGILHRDISPDNIYITKDGDVKLLDFGAARQVLGEKSKSLSVILKPGFAPFEQYQTRGNQGPWTDIYALAATMYYCLTGQIPEAAMDRMEVDNIKTLSEFNVNVSKNLEQILQKALSIKGIDRYQTMGEFKQAIVKTGFITPINENTPVAKIHQKPVEKEQAVVIKPTIKNRKFIISLAVAGALLIFTCINFAIWQNSQNESTVVSRNGNATQNSAEVSSNGDVTQNMAEVTNNENSTSNSVAATSNESTSQNSTKAKEPSITVDADTSVSGEISFSSSNTNLMDTLLSNYVADFNKQYPNVKVNIETIGNSDEYKMKIETMMAAGESPDVWSVNYSLFNKNRLADFNLPLDGYDFTKDFLFTDNFTGSDGKIYALPQGTTATGVVYNKKLFKKLKIEVPKTLDEMLSAGKKITKAGKVGLATAAKDSWPLYIYWSDIPTMFAGDSGYLNSLATQKAPFTITSPMGKSFSLLKTFKAAGIIEKNPFTSDWASTIKNFSDGELGMFLIGNWVVPTVLEGSLTLDDIGFFPLPYDNSGEYCAVVYPDQALGMAKYSKHIDAQEVFFKFMMDTNYSNIAKDLNLLTSRKSVSINLPYAREFESLNPRMFSVVPDSEGYIDLMSKADAYNQDLAIDVLKGKDIQARFDSLNAKWK